jgi:hypothetical protein
MLTELIKTLRNKTAGTEDKMTSSRSGSRRPTTRSGALTHTNLPQNSVAAHRRTASEQGSTAAISEASSRNLYSKSNTMGSAQMDDNTNDNSGTSITSEKQRFSVEEAQDILDDSKETWAKMKKLQSQLKAAQREGERHSDLSHTRQARIDQLEAKLEQEQQRTFDTDTELNRMVTDLKRSLKQREQNILRLNNDLHVAQHNAIVAHNSRLQTVAALRQEVAIRETQLAEALRENERVKQTVEDCKARIFKMQPFQAITDDQISKAYCSLCESIENWVATTFGEVDNALITMIATMESQYPNYDVKDHVDMTALKTAQGYPLTDNIVLTSVFLEPIYRKLLDPRLVFPGLSKTEEDLLRAVLEGLKQMQPAKGKPRIDLEGQSDV